MKEGFFILAGMKKMNASDLYSFFQRHPEISTDSRKIKENGLFFALKGPNFNGNQFAADALKKGAAYAIIDEEKYHQGENYLLVDDCLKALQELAIYHRKNLNIPIIGITGSNGKTTTKELINAVLKSTFNTLATSGNLNNHIGVPLSILSITAEHEVAIIEMGANHQGEIAFLSSIARPDIGMITNIGKAHLEGFGGIEGVKKGKSELYRFLESSNGLVVLNQDDETLKELCKVKKRLTYGQASSSNVKGILECSEPIISGSWTTSLSSGKFNAQLYGTYNFYNILAAIAFGTHFKVSSEKISRAIESYQSDNNRSQIIDRGSYQLFLDAYNANPNSMMEAIKSFESQTTSLQKNVVLGDMFELGEDAANEHQGLIDYLLASREISRIVLVGKNFYSLKVSDRKVLFFSQTADAKKWFQTLDKRGNTFLLKGSRGMKMETIIE